MSQKAKNWTIVLGCFVSFIGLLFFPTALTAHGSDTNLLGAGMAIFSLGILMIGGSLYFKAKALGAQLNDTSMTTLLSGKVRKGVVCDLCRKSVPVIQCTMHKLGLCAHCMTEHYESRACVYVPAVRKPVNKAARGLAKAKGV
jgi:hypothetical protein